MSNPTSWADVESCECPFCRQIAAIRERCLDADEFLFVLDCRMHGYGFCPADIRLVFRTVAVVASFDDLADAIAWVFGWQERCDALVSSWPTPGETFDFDWRTEHSRQDSEVALIHWEH